MDPLIAQYSTQQDYQTNQQNFQINLQPSQEQEDQYVMEKFMNMCATIIQKFYRGHLMRRRHYHVVNQIQRFHDLLWAVILGWRVRKIMKLKRMQDLTQEMKTLIWKRREQILSIRESLPKIPKDYDSQFMRYKEKGALKTAMNSNQQYKFMTNELDPLQKEFLTTINRLMVTGLWIYEDKHYKKNIQTIVTSFTIIDQSKNTKQDSYQVPQQFTRSQFITPTQSQYLSPPNNNQNKMVYATPLQQQRVGFYPQQSQNAAPVPNGHNQYIYPEASQIQSIYQDQYYNQPDNSKDVSTVQMGSTRQVQIERQLNYNMQSQENPLPQKKSFDEFEQKRADLPLVPLQEAQQNFNNIQNSNNNKTVNGPVNPQLPISKQNSKELKQESKKQQESTGNQEGENEQEQQQKQQGFSWDDVPVGAARKKFNFEEFPTTTITTDIKPTIPKKKLQKLKEQKQLEEENKDSSRKNSDEQPFKEEKKEMVKKSAKNKVQKKYEESDDNQISQKKSLPRSQTEFPLVYQGDLDTGTNKSKNKNNNAPLTKEEKEEKERKEKFLKMKNLKKRMKYDPRKAIENEKNGIKEKQEEEEENIQDSIDEEGYEEPQKEQVSDKEMKNRSKSTHIPSKKEKEQEKNEKQAEQGDGNFLKRQSKNMVSQKLNWKKTESRVDCWSSWNKRSKNFNQVSQNNFINNTPTKRKITLSSHNQQNSARSNGNEFSFAQNKLHSVSEVQQFQQKVRNKFGLNGHAQSTSSLTNDKNILSPQQSMTMIKQNNWLHTALDQNQKSQMFGNESQTTSSFMKLPNLDLNSLQNISTGDLLKLREALIPIIQTNLIFIEQNDPKIFTKIAKEILKSSTPTNNS